MMLRIVAHLSFVVAVLVGSLSTMSTAHGETLYQSNVDTRVVVALQVRPEAVQQWLSGPWQVNPVAAGPSKGSNLSLVFVDQHLVQDPEGKPMSGGINRILALVAPGKHSGTAETAPVVLRLYTASPSYVPGPYKNALSATVRRERTVSGPNLEPASGRESWSVRATAGAAVVPPAGLSAVAPAMTRGCERRVSRLGARRPTSSADDQSQNCQGPRVDDPAVALTPSRSGD